MIKDDDDLDKMLIDMLGPEKAKQFTYGSQHASVGGRASIAGSKAGSKLSHLPGGIPTT